MAYLILLLGLLGASCSFNGTSLHGEHWSSPKLPISLRLSLIGERGVLSLVVPLVQKTLSPSPRYIGEIGGVEDQGERDPGRNGEGFGK